MPSVHQTGFVPSSNGLKERACGDRALIDEDVNVITFPSGDVRRADPSTPSLFTGRFFVLRRKLEFNELGGLCSHDVVKTVKHALGGRYIEEAPPLGFEMKTAPWMSQCVVNHNVNNSGCFGWTSLEGEPSGCVLKEMLNRNHGPVRHAIGLDLRFYTVFHDDARSSSIGGFARNLEF